MKCYEFENGEIKTGFTLTEHEKFGRVVLLGIAGASGENTCRVSLDKNNPAVIRDNRVTEAWLRTIYVKNRASFTVLQRPFREYSKNKPPILVRVNTSSPSFNDKINGSWRQSAGSPQLIFKSTGMRTKSRFCDDIVQLREGDGIVVNSEGNSKEIEIMNKKGAPVLTPLT